MKRLKLTHDINANHLKGLAWVGSIIYICLIVFTLVGCSSQQGGSAKSNSAPVRMHMPQGFTMAPKAKPAPTDAELPGLTAKVKKLEMELKSKPNDKGLIQQTADANFRAGYAMMMSQKTDRKFRYRMALRYFRRTLQLDPQNADAASYKQLIESIYRSLNLPIPK